MVNFVSINSQAINTQESEFYVNQEGSGQLISFEQSVVVEVGGSLILVEQTILSVLPSHLDRTGWTIHSLIIGGQVIPENQIHGTIRVTRTEGTAALMECTLITPAGVQQLDDYAGQDIILNVQTTDGIFRMFTGIVDIPEVDIIQKKITLRCTDQRTELLNAQLASTVSTIGYFSSHVFGDIEDVAQEVEYRLSTIPYAIDFDAYGNYTLTPWAAKTTPDFTLTNDDVYYNEPRVEFNSRGRITNQVNINSQFRFERLYNMDRAFAWTSPIATDIGKLLLDGYSLTFRSMIQSAVDAAGWPVRGNINFTNIWPSGWYNVGQPAISVAFSTLQYDFENIAQTDAFGAPILDVNGNQVYEVERVGGTDYAGLYCMGANWNATTRWAQSVSENYSLIVRATRSQARYGTISQDTSIGITADFDSSGWEDYKAYNDTGNGTGSYYINQDINRSEFNDAVLVVLNRAKTTILGSHRDTRVIVDTKIWPQVDLKHTVRVNTTPLIAKGKVYTIEHFLNVGTGEARTTTTIVLSRLDEAPIAETVLAAPSPPVDNPIIPSSGILLGNHFGQNPATTPGSSSWTGMIGNKWTIENNNKFRTQYQESFVVDVPAIPDNIRQSKELGKGVAYEVNIPNDELTVIF